MGGSWVLGYKGPWIEGQEDNSKVSGEVGVSLEGGWDEKKNLEEQELKNAVLGEMHEIQKQ